MMPRYSMLAILGLALGCSSELDDRGAALHAAAGSCVGHCGEQAPAGCYCDAQCAQHGDCCDNAADVCTVLAAHECGDQTGEDDSGGGGQNEVCFLGPNRASDVCFPLAFPGSPLGYSYPSPLNGNYRAPIAYLDLQAIDTSTQIAPNFTLAEFASEAKGRYAVVQPHAIARVQDLRDAAGSLRINSGYRSPSYNSSVGGASNSRHMFGDGFDIDPVSISVNALEPKCSANGGFLVEYSTHVHCDWRNTPQDVRFFGAAAQSGAGPDDFAFELPFRASIVEHDGVFTVEAQGFDEGDPLLRWTALGPDHSVVESFTGPAYTPPAEAAILQVDVGRVVEAVTNL